MRCRTPMAVSHGVNYRGRYAPSPSGPLHLGNLRTALLAWLLARRAHGVFVLRLEDLDRPRVRPGAAAAILSDLRWLGLDWDEGPDVGGHFAPYRQSDRMELYKQYAGRLLEDRKAYLCFCTAEELQARRARADAEQEQY